MKNEQLKKIFNDESILEQMFEILENEQNFSKIKDILIQYRKYESQSSEIIEKIAIFFDENFKNYFNDDKIEIKDFLLIFQELVEDGRLKFEYRTISKLNLPQINLRSKSGHKALYDDDEYENNLRSSVKNKLVIWKSCQEIFPNEDLVILPENLDYSCFKQGNIGDCYFISCIHALSEIPQLLNYIFLLLTEEQNNQVTLDQENFKVNFFIDGEWKIINIKNSFPIEIIKNDETGETKEVLLGVEPNKNELFLMILEKAWAKINGGYDKIESGNIYNIFELFLGCKCDSYYELKKNYVFINSLYERIKLNEKFCGNLSLCASKYYEVDKKKMEKDKYTYDKKECLKKGKINESKYGHAYTIIKTFEIIIEPKRKYNYAFNTVKFLIISNPHGKGSELIGSGIELKKISEILNKKFSNENKKKYEYILDINKKYEETGIIYMPLDYFKEWCTEVSVCYAHYDCLNYTLDINNDFDYLYIYKIKSKNRQYFTCQICFPSYRVHKKDMDQLYVSLEIDQENIYEDNILLYCYNCGIKIIKYEDFSNVEEPYFSDEFDKASIKEIKTLLEIGEYIIMIYIESSLDKAVLRFLTEDEINIYLINKIPKGKKKNTLNKFVFNSFEDIQNLFNNYDYSTYNNLINKIKKKDIISYKFKPKDFLQGIRQYYLYFKKLSQKLEINPEDAIYSISKEGNAYNYSIMNPNEMNKIFGIKKGKTEIEDIISLNTLIFRDNYGNPYRVNNLNELREEMKINQNPFSCLLTEYNEKHKIMKSGIVHLKVLRNKKKNEDILIVTDKKGNYIKREQKPLMIILLDTSKSLENYYVNLQNKIIPQLLEKLGYIGIKDKMPELDKLIKEKKISKFDLLMLWSSKIRREKFLKDNELKKTYSEDKIKEIGKILQDIIILITFSDKSELYFYDKSDFENCQLSGTNTYFRGAAKHLNNILNNISRERSIRLLCFSDGEIYDAEESKKILEKMFKNTKNRHQIKSLSIRVCHEKAEPDTKLLMKLANFSYPMSGMDQIDIDPNEVDEVVEKLSENLLNDDMDYNIKISSSVLMMSNDFSDQFSYEQYYNKRNRIFRVCGGHKSIEYYRNLVKNGSLRVSTGQKIEIDEGGDLTGKNLNKIMKYAFSKIAQKNLEEKVNKNKDKKIQSIKDYIKETESDLKYKPSEYLEKMDNIKEINKMNSKQISNSINQVKEDAEEIIYKNEAEFLKDEKNNLKNKIEKNIPNIDKEIKALNKKKSKKKYKLISIKEELNFNKENNSKYKELETEIESKNKIFEKKENQSTSRITTFYGNNKEIKENLIYDKNIIIEKENFKNGYHQIIYLKSNNNEIKSSEKSEKNDKIKSLSELDEFQNKIIECLEKGENTLFTSNENIDKTKIVERAIKLAKAEEKKIIYVCPKKSLSKRKYHELKILNSVGIITEDMVKNNRASCIVLTTELLRNLFFKNNHSFNNLLNEIYFVIFDDIFFKKNSKNFSALEEIIIFFNNEIKFLFLFSPFPNMTEFGIWMTKIKKEKFNIIYSSLRSIKLRHYIFTDNKNIINNNTKNNLFLILESKFLKNENIGQDDSEEIFHDENLNQVLSQLENNNIKDEKNMIKIENKKPNLNLNRNMDLSLIKKLYLDKFCPVIIFCNSKEECEKNSKDLFQDIYEYNMSIDRKLTKKSLRKKGINEKIEFNNKNLIEKIKDEYNELLKIKCKKSSDFLIYLSKGIGYYHNDMLPIQKEIVEIFFQKEYIKILFSTENFYLPSKTIILTSLYNKKEERFLKGNEYYQITKRAGRKKDNFGNIIIMLNKNIKKEEYLSIIKGKPEPLNSCFKLSYNLVANLINVGVKIENILSKAFYQFQMNNNLLILQKILIKLFSDYLKNDFNDEVREVKIKEIYEIKNNLRELKNNFFNPNNIEPYLSFGRIIKIKYFGYGILLNKEKKLNNEKNNYIIREYNLIKIKKNNDNLLFNEEENFYEQNNYIDFDIDNEEIIINNKYLRNETYLDNIIKKYIKPSDDNNEDEIKEIIENDEIIEKSQENDNNSNEDNKEYILDILVSLKPYHELNDFLCPGDFESNSFYGIISLDISMIEEIYDVFYKIENDSKEKNKVENLGKYLIEMKKKFGDKFPALDIINEYKKAIGIKNINDLREKIEDDDIFDSLVEISDVEREYNQLKKSYIKKYIIPDKNENNNIMIKINNNNNIDDDDKTFETDLEKYDKNVKLIEKMEKVLTKIEDKNNLSLKIKLPKIKTFLYKLDLITRNNKGEELTKKGELMCDISCENNNIILSELFSSLSYGKLRIKNICMIICFCLKKKILEKKDIKNSIINNLNKDEIKKIDKDSIFKIILEKLENIANIFVACKLFENKDDKIKFINNFNDEYLFPVFKWMKSDKKIYSFNQLIKDYDDIYSEKNLIDIFKKLKRALKNLEESIFDNLLKSKFQLLGKKINSFLPSEKSIYLE